MPQRLIAYAVPLFFAAAASASEPAALVIDVLGESDPAVAPFDELAAGDVVRLGDGAELIVMHYASCRELHLVGGGVAVGADALTPEGGEVIADDAVECPEKVEFSEKADAAGAVVLRSDGAATAVAPRPVFVSPTAGSVEVWSDDRLVGTATFDGGVALWPEGAPDLIVGAPYLLRLTDGGGETAEAAATVRADAGPALVRLP